MDWKQLFTGVIKLIAWPIVVVIIVVLLKGQLDRLVGVTQKYRYGDFGVSFSEQINQIKKNVLSAVPATSKFIVKHIPVLVLLCSRLKRNGTPINIKGREIAIS